MKVLMMITSIILFAQSNDSNSDWRIVDDVVMGGESQGMVKFSKEGNLVFHGKVSLENNGGFSSVRKRFEKVAITTQKKVKIKLKGDGKSYQFRLKADASQEFAYIHIFETTGKWQEIEWSLDEMYPQFRGRKLRMPNFNEPQLEEIGFLIANKKNEQFKLEIASIELF
jgi:hypothetical protein